MPGWQSGKCAGLEKTKVRESRWSLGIAGVQIPYPAPKFEKFLQDQIKLKCLLKDKSAEAVTDGN